MTETFGRQRGRERRELSTRDFRRVARVLEREAGIELVDSKRAMVHSRLLRRLKALRLSDFGDYCDYLEGEGATEERARMVSVLTTNVTSFFREAHHFEFLREHRIPEIRQRLEAGGSVRVWSTGCSSGEEPYSLAMTFLDCIPEIARYDFRILATDIDDEILNLAVSGRYAEAALSTVPDAMKAAYFPPPEGDGDVREISPAVRRLVSFRILNLIEPWPLTRSFDVIMCRNVVIYFSDAAKAEVWRRLLHQLKPDGWLITGHSERLPASNDADAEFLFTTTFRPSARFLSNQRGAN